MSKRDTHSLISTLPDARSADSAATGKVRKMCKCIRSGDSSSKIDSPFELVSSRADTLYRIMKSEQEEKKHHVRLSKCQKIRFRKNRLWDRKQKNGPVIHIDPKDYQKSG